MPDRSQPQSFPRHRTLFQHFFRRFFDNDTLPISGDPETSVLRAICFCAIPALMFTVWLLPHYPNRPPWIVDADRYFFVLFSFVVMGTVATCEWEMLFPDRSDFLILLPMPLKSRELLLGKGRALLSLFGMFLVGANFFSSILFPAVSTASSGNPLHALWAHMVAVIFSGVFGAFSLLTIEGLLICFVPGSWFRAISTLVQTISITVLLLLFLLYPLISSHLEALMQDSQGVAEFIPPLWFLALYEKLALGNGAPAAAPALAAVGVYATAVAVIFAVLTYALAWARQKKRAIEGASATRVQRRGSFTPILNGTLLRRPQRRGIFHFLAQTISRSPRYQVFLALYAGTGLALALCTVVTLSVSSNGTLEPGLSIAGLHAAPPLLIFWIIAGVRASFAFPIDLSARWIFPIALRLDGSDAAPGLFPGSAAKASRTWVRLCCAAFMCLLLLLLLALHWGLTAILTQAVCMGAISLLLTDLFFLGRTQIPFTRIRVSELAVAFLLYVVFFPALIQLTVQLEYAAEARPTLLLWTVLGTLSLHQIFRYADHLAQRGIIGGFPEDESDPGPQTLGLAQFTHLDQTELSNTQAAGLHS